MYYKDKCKEVFENDEKMKEKLFIQTLINLCENWVYLILYHNSNFKMDAFDK